MVMACHSAHSCWRSRSEFDTGTVPVPADTTNQSQLMMLMVKTVIETCQQVYVDMSGTATLLLACARLHPFKDAELICNLTQHTDLGDPLTPIVV